MNFTRSFNKNYELFTINIGGSFYIFILSFFVEEVLEVTLYTNKNEVTYIPFAIDDYDENKNKMVEKYGIIEIANSLDQLLEKLFYSNMLVDFKNQNYKWEYIDTTNMNQELEKLNSNEPDSDRKDELIDELDSVIILSIEDNIKEKIKEYGFEWQKSM